VNEESNATIGWNETIGFAECPKCLASTYLDDKIRDQDCFEVACHDCHHLFICCGSEKALEKYLRELREEEND
jgi:hypothetical protein